MNGQFDFNKKEVIELKDNTHTHTHTERERERERERNAKEMTVNDNLQSREDFVGQ